MNPKNIPFIEKIKAEIIRKLNITETKELEILDDDLNDAVADALDYCNRDVIVGNMSSAIKDLYIFRYNTEGNEGETSRSEGGVSQTFEIGIPAKVQTKLNRYRVANVRSLK